MISNLACLAVVAARGGSKGLPGKNLADLGGRPLVAWSVAAARASIYLDRIVVSSDDDAILSAAMAAGCDTAIRRPVKLATDDAPVAEAVIHALESISEDFAIVVLLAATSPLRIGADIDACIRACHGGAPAAVSVRETEKPAEWICRLDKEGRLTPVLPGAGLHSRRQDIAASYLPNGAVYAAQVGWFLHNKTFYGPGTVGCIMPSARSVDIDQELDLAVARCLVDKAAAIEGSAT